MGLPFVEKVSQRAISVSALSHPQGSSKACSVPSSILVVSGSLQPTTVATRSTPS